MSPKRYFIRPVGFGGNSGEDYDFSRTDVGHQGLPGLRLLAALFLRDRNPEAAENLVPQLESEILVVPSFRKHEAPSSVKAISTSCQMT